MKVVFMGTPDFAVPSLESLIKSDNQVVAVITQPDKPRGRKMTLTPPEVKVCALSHGLPVYQPQSLKTDEAFEIIKGYLPDVIAVAAYGKILPQAILSLPKYGCINVHGSLLPRYRGAAPIQRAVLNGDDETGVTTMQMGPGLDTGDMLLTCKTKILPDETSGELFDRLAVMGGELLVKTLESLQNGTITPEKQDDNLATYAKMIDKSMCPLDFTKTAIEVHNQIRGLKPWPVATATLNGAELKIHKSRVADGSGVPGRVISTKPLTVACAEGAVEILEIQPIGKKIMDSAAYLLGHSVSVGDEFNK